MRFDVVTIFPEMFVSPLETSIFKRALGKGQMEVHFHDIRQSATDRHRTVDDVPYGGGAGMVMKPEPLVETVEGIPSVGTKRLRIFLSPQGEVFSQKMAVELASYDQLILICGHYEGIDERALELCVDREISIGDYVLTGGELPALVMMDSVIRLKPGVLGNASSLQEESHTNGLLEYPHYTRPAVYRGKKVPDVLLSGNHSKIEAWRKEESLKRTRARRPDLIKRCN